MRSRIFRTLAGIVGAMLVWFLAFADHPPLSWRQTVAYWFLAAMFVSYAILGDRGAEFFERLIVGSAKRDQSKPENSEKEIES